MLTRRTVAVGWAVFLGGSAFNLWRLYETGDRSLDQWLFDEPWQLVFNYVTSGLAILSGLTLALVHLKKITPAPLHQSYNDTIAYTIWITGLSYVGMIALADSAYFGESRNDVATLWYLVGHAFHAPIVLGALVGSSYVWVPGMVAAFSGGRTRKLERRVKRFLENPNPAEAAKIAEVMHSKNLRVDVESLAERVGKRWYEGIASETDARTVGELNNIVKAKIRTTKEQTEIAEGLLDLARKHGGRRV